jgi:hypothetical protein
MGIALVGACALGAVGLWLTRRPAAAPAPTDNLARAAARIAPGAVYYGVMQRDQQVGFASSTIDTADGAITVRDYFVANLPIGGAMHRASATIDATLSRALRLRRFDFALSTEGAPIHSRGVVEGDSVLVVTTKSGSDRATTQRVPLTSTVLLPTVVPIAAALGSHLEPGREIVLPVLDPSSMAPKPYNFAVTAESVFVLADTARYDADAKRWDEVGRDTVRAWNIMAPDGGGFSGWIDAQGHIVSTGVLGFTLKRLPYEVAFENWRSAMRASTVTSDRDVLETTAIAADQRVTHRTELLRVRLTGVDLGGFDLDGTRQRLSGDTLTISSEPASLLTAPYRLPTKGLDPLYTRAEPLIQSTDPHIVALARRIAANVPDPSDPRAVAQAINAWVHDSITERITVGIPSAVQVLQTRTGDCNEHTQLYVALARSLGIPARIAAGLAYVSGKFYYHAWPEIQLGDWVAVDPTFGQFPADAAHLRFVVGGITRQTELLRLMGALHIDVLEARGTLHIPISER